MRVCLSALILSFLSGCGFQSERFLICNYNDTVALKFVVRGDKIGSVDTWPQDAMKCVVSDVSYDCSRKYSASSRQGLKLDRLDLTYFFVDLDEKDPKSGIYWIGQCRFVERML